MILTSIGSPAIRLCLAIVLLLLHVPASAAEEEHGSDHKHHMALFLGNTHTDGGEDGFTVGVEYEFALMPKIGVGILAEYADVHSGTWIVGTPLVVRPYKGLKLVAMPSAEFTNGHEEFLLRLGIGYSIPVGQWVLTPEFNVDFVDSDENLVYGVGISRRF